MNQQQRSDYGSTRGITAAQIVAALGYTPAVSPDSPIIDGGNASSPMIGTLDGGIASSTYTETMDGGSA